MILRVAASASASRRAWTSAPASLNSVSTFPEVRCGLAPTTRDTKQRKRSARIKPMPLILATESTKGTNAFAKTFVLLCLLWRKILEDELEGELHLPAPLFADVTREIVRVIKVAVRERTVYVIQHVVSREPELNIERLADRRDWEVLEERRIPVKLLVATEHVATKRTDARRLRTAREKVRVAWEHFRNRAAKRVAVQLQSLRSLRVSWRRVTDQIDASTIARTVVDWPLLPRDDVVELPATNRCIQSLVHVRSVTPVTSKRKIPNVRERKAVPHVSVGVTAVEFGPRRI